MALINISNLSFSYDGNSDILFNNANLQIDTNWKTGLIGRNGRGKTTLLKCLTGDLHYNGQIIAPCNFLYFPYCIRNKHRNTIDIAKELCPEVETWELTKEFALLDTDCNILYRPFNTLSSGEQAKVMISILFLIKDGFPLIDEPTNHLDARGRIAIANYLQRKKGFILVSHDRSVLDQCIDHVISINRQDIDIQRGNYSTWSENKDKQDAYATSKYKFLLQEAHRLDKSARENTRWANKAEHKKNGTKKHTDNKASWRTTQSTKSKKAMSRAKTIESRKLAAENKAKGLLDNIELLEKLRISQEQHHSHEFARLENVAIKFDNIQICCPVSFTIEKGDRISLAGVNGAGKSSILKLIYKNNIQFSGNLYCATNLLISYVPQDVSFLSGSIYEYALEHGIDMSLFLTILSKMNIPKSQVEKNMKYLSEGQKKKILLARSICQTAHLHIWDEPLNYIDIITRVQIEELILQYKPTLLFVEHDKAFCDNIATKTIQVFPQKSAVK